MDSRIVHTEKGQTTVRALDDVMLVAQEDCTRPVEFLDQGLDARSVIVITRHCHDSMGGFQISKGVSEAARIRG